MFTPKIRRHFVEFVPGDTLMNLKLATKGWKAAADALIEDGVTNGEIIVHDGEDLSWAIVKPRREGRELVTRVIFFLNIKKVGQWACGFAANLIVVDILRVLRASLISRPSVPALV